VRRFRSGRVTGHDEIVELVPNRRFAYAHTSNLPVRNYRGEIDLEPTSEGTAIRWVSTFDPKVPGTGGLMRRGLARFIAQCTDGLAEHAASLVGGRSAS
jgi:Polyketide cyclase / dehydrase and lipid transport